MKGNRMGGELYECIIGCTENRMERDRMEMDRMERDRMERESDEHGIRSMECQKSCLERKK